MRMLHESDNVIMILIMLIIIIMFMIMIMKMIIIMIMLMIVMMMIFRPFVHPCGTEPAVCPPAWSPPWRCSPA